MFSVLFNLLIISGDPSRLGPQRMNIWGLPVRDFYRLDAISVATNSVEAPKGYRPMRRLKKYDTTRGCHQFQFYTLYQMHGPIHIWRVQIALRPTGLTQGARMPSSSVPALFGHSWYIPSTDGCHPGVCDVGLGATSRRLDADSRSRYTRASLRCSL